MWDKSTLRLLGVNVFGIRLRHERLDSWLREGKTIDYVMENLASANFDPEFFDRHEEGIVAQFGKRRVGAIQ